MIRTRANDVAGLGQQSLHDAAEIHSLTAALPTPKSRPLLQPGEEALSLPPPGPGPDPKLQMLSQSIGAPLSFDNPVWRGNPLPPLRGLQKLLLEQALAQPPEARATYLDAIRIVEQAVQMRLRWQQMRRSDGEPERALQLAQGDEDAREQEEHGDGGGADGGHRPGVGAHRRHAA